jgi:hypothetical protein
MRQVNFKPHSRLKNPRYICELSVQVIINSGGGGNEEKEEEGQEEEQGHVQAAHTHAWGVGGGVSAVMSKPKVKNTASLRRKVRGS